MRSYINNGKVHNWSLSKEDLKNIASRPNFKYEQSYKSFEEADDMARHRSMGTWKKVSVWNCKDEYIVCAHGVEKVDWTLIKSYRKGILIN